MLAEARELLDEGDLGTAKLMLRDVVQTTVGFEWLATSTSLSTASVQETLSLEGKPDSSELARMLGLLEDKLKSCF